MMCKQMLLLLNSILVATEFLQKKKHVEENFCYCLNFGEVCKWCRLYCA